MNMAGSERAVLGAANIEQRNLRRRERRAGQVVNQLKAQAQGALAVAKAEAARLLQEARDEAALLKEQVLVEAAEEKAAAQREIDELQTQVKSLTDLNDKRVASASYTAKFRSSRLRRLAQEAEEDRSEVPNKKRRSEIYAVSEIIRIVKRLTACHNIASKLSIMKRFWTHKAMRQLHPTSFGCPKQDLSWKTAAHDVKSVLQAVKYARRKDHKAAKDIILSSLSGKEVTSKRCQTALAKALCVKSGPMYAAAKVRNLLDGDETLRFPLGQRKQRSDRISEEIRGEVAWFWETFTRVSPNKDGNARKRIGKNDYEVHRVHWLEDTEAEYFFKFQDWLKKEGKQYTIGFRSFQAMKPFFIRTMKDRNVCCCKQHVEMHLLCKAFFNQRQTLHPKPCNCTCAICIPPVVFQGPVERDGTLPAVDLPEEPVICKVQKCSLPSVRAWCASTLCMKEEIDDRWYKRECLVGTCEDCGPSLLALCSWEERLDLEACVTWETYEYVILDDLPKPHRRKKTQPAADDGQPAKLKKRLRLVKKTTSMRVFMEKVWSTVEAFIKHDFYARWQGEQYQNCLKTFPKGTIVSSIDFAENYTFAVQDEVQSLHWDNRQITILVLITYRHQHDREEDDPVVHDSNGKKISRFIEADYHFFISDDNSHDTFFVQHCLNFHWTWMKEQGFLVKNHIMWSDGCAAQFKACRPFSYVAKYYQEYGARMMWCFHASGHGKGVQDGLGGGVKSAIRKEQLRTERVYPMEGAKDAVSFLKERFCIGKGMEYDKKQGVRRFFWEIKVQEVQRSLTNECLPIKGVRQMHCFLGYSENNPMMLKCRELACFCEECVVDAENHNKCENQAWVRPWDVDHVFPLQPQEIASIIQQLHPGLDANDCDYENYLGDLVEVGDYFAVLAEEGNVWDAEFYILLCTQVATIVEEDFRDDYGAEFCKGDRVVVGIWYQQYGRSKKNFVRYEKSTLSYVDVASIVHIKFGLVPTTVVSGSPGFELSPSTLDAILCSADRANPNLSTVNLYG